MVVIPPALLICFPCLLQSAGGEASAEVGIQAFEPHTGPYGPRHHCLDPNEHFVLLSVWTKEKDLVESGWHL